MSKADEMFKELGYKKSVGGTTEVYMSSRHSKCIYFSKLINRIKFDGTYTFIDMEELQAINEKVGELRMDKINEIWKDIPEYEGLYQASNLGNIKSLKRYKQNHSKLQLVNEKILSKHINKTNGYEYVVLTKNGIEKNIRVHRLIANTFIPNIKKLPQINHKDGNKKNNRVDNLEWCTNKENVIHAHKTGLAENKNKIKVNQYDLQGNLINTYRSIVEASKNTGISIGNISLCINNKRKTANKYIWKRG